MNKEEEKQYRTGLLEGTRIGLRDGILASKRRYETGYNTGDVMGRRTERKKGWPDHKPPLPPDETLRKILTAANALRDEVSDWLGSISTEIEGDPVWEGFQSRLDDYDDIMEEISSWLKRLEE